MLDGTRISQILFAGTGILLVFGVGTWTIGLAAADLEESGFGWSLLAFGFVIGAVAGMASRAYRYDSILPFVTVLVLSICAWRYLSTLAVVTDGWIRTGVPALAFVGYLLTGNRPNLLRFVRQTSWYRNRTQNKIKKYIAQGVNIAPEDSAYKCKLCSIDRPVKAYVRDTGATVDPWLLEFGDRLACCPHNPRHVYHVIHFMENDWLCPTCSRPLFPDLMNR